MFPAALVPSTKPQSGDRAVAAGLEMGRRLLAHDRVNASKDLAHPATRCVELANALACVIRLEAGAVRLCE